MSFTTHHMSKHLLTIKDENFCFFAEISAKFRVSAGSETKEEGEMSMTEISKNFAKNRRNFSEISVKEKFRRFFQKIASSWKISEKDRFVSVYFGDFSLIL